MLTLHHSVQCDIYTFWEDGLCIKSCTYNDLSVSLMYWRLYNAALGLPFSLWRQHQNINSFCETHFWHFSYFSHTGYYRSVNTENKRTNKLEAAVNYWVTFQVPEEVCSWERRWRRCPHFTLTAFTQLKREDTATLSGVTNIEQPACVSLFWERSSIGVVRKADDKKQKENPPHQPLKEWSQQCSCLKKRSSYSVSMEFIATIF